MSVSRRVIHHGLYFAVLGPLIGVLFLVLYIFFAKEPLVLLVIIQVLPLFLLMSITTGAIPAMLTGVMVACLPEKIGSQKNYRCLAGGIGGVVITEIYCAVIVHIKGMASSELFENILSGDLYKGFIIAMRLVVQDFESHPPFVVLNDKVAH